MKYNFGLLSLFLLVAIFSPKLALANDAKIDPTLEVGLGIDASGVYALTTEADEQILVGGSFNSYNGVWHRGIVRVNNNGEIDGSFNKGHGLNSCLDDNGVDNCSINTISVQSGGGIIIGGNFTHFNDLPTGSAVRLFKDGTLDENFHSLGGANNAVYSSFIQKNGQILLGGNFTTYNGKPFKTLVRLNPDGLVDGTFNISFNDGATIYNIDQQPDGKIIIAGWFCNVNGQPVRNIARLNQDGSLDDTFNYQIGSNMLIKDFVVDQDGKITAVGHFTLYGNMPFNHIVRLKNNGAIDKNFDVGVGANDVINTISLDKDGRVIIGGRFKMYDGVPRSRIARINKNGSLDKDFDPGLGFSDQVFTSLIDKNGKILLGGWFTEYNGFKAQYLIRLVGSSF